MAESDELKALHEKNEIDLAWASRNEGLAPLDPDLDPTATRCSCPFCDHLLVSQCVEEGCACCAFTPES
jgi:hypothetical protein